jgi:hypothetical protein
MKPTALKQRKDKKYQNETFLNEITIYLRTIAMISYRDGSKLKIPVNVAKIKDTTN